MMDATHGTNQYDFKMVTIMTKNLNHQGEPLAHLFSTKEDGPTLKHFLTAFRNECGKIQCKAFMSDSASQYFQSWCCVMVDKDDDQPKKLLCAWHVIEAFKNNLNKVKCTAKREDVIDELLTVMKTLDEKEFEIMFQRYQTKLQKDPDCVPYYQYLMAGYGKDPKDWAYCYRKGLQVNTNMSLETMHRNLKHVYFQGNVVKRLDEAIQHLHKFLKDRKHDWIITRTKGKATKKTSNIFKKHKLAVEWQWCYVINPLGENVYLVENTIKGTSYVVELEEQCDCGELCYLECTDCRCCLNRISCTCPDNSIKFELCKHCHLVNLFLQNNFASGQILEVHDFQSGSVGCDAHVANSEENDEIDDTENLCLSPMILSENNLFLQHNYAKSCLMAKIDFAESEPFFDGYEKGEDQINKNRPIQRLRTTFENLIKDLESDSNEKNINHINDLLSKEHQRHILKKSV